MMNKRMWKIILAVASIGLVLCVGYIVYYSYCHMGQGQQEDYYEQLAENATASIEVETEVEMMTIEESTTSEEQVAETEENKYISEIDFQKLQSEENADIYAWIQMDNTVIDYPVLQHPSDDTYYLMHNIDGSYGYPGCIYAELYNSNTFEDPVTVLYGHNMKNGTMFGSLHQFEDESFFEENKEFVIYMPDKTLVYDIAIAKETDDKRITVWYNFEEETSYQKYIDELLSGEESELYRRREEIEITTEDRLVVLQTCVSERKSNRYVVVGVLREIIE